jgi:hypothetical protein
MTERTHCWSARILRAVRGHPCPHEREARTALPAESRRKPDRRCDSPSVESNFAKVGRNLLPVEPSLVAVERNAASVERNLAPVARNVAPVGGDFAPVGRNFAPVARNLTPVGRNFAWGTRNLRERRPSFKASAQGYRLLFLSNFAIFKLAGALAGASGGSGTKPGAVATGSFTQVESMTPPLPLRRATTFGSSSRSDG